MDIIGSELYIADEKLRDFAAATAKLLHVTGESGGVRCALALQRDAASVRRCHDAVARRYSAALSPPPACEWLLDNWYIVRRETLTAVEALRQGRRLRRTGERLLIDELCRALVRSSRGRLDAARCRSFLDGFQSVTVLRRAELRLFPAALRAALIAALRDVCAQLPYAADTAPHAAAFEALFGSLRLLSVWDMEKLLDEADVCGAILSEDPGGTYPRMDAETRRSYLERLATKARERGQEEAVLARQLIRQAAETETHVGLLLFPRGRSRGAGVYIALNLLSTLFLSLFAGIKTGSPLAAVLLLLPVSELVKSLADTVLLHLVPPRRLPRMDLENGVPPEGRTLCVLTALLSDEAGAELLAKRLEECRLANRKAGAELCFGLLADLPAANAPRTENDEKVLRAARAAVQRLNRRYGGGFYLFTRPRSFDGERWQGHERKRGALLELSRLLCDRPSALAVTGERDALAGTRYILTLDSDTRMYPGAALEMIGAMLHPLNAPVLDEKHGLVTEGYALIHPRIATELSSANETDFALIFAGLGGSDPYGALSGELYSSVFDSGGFAGKGILDARALLLCSEKHLPDGQILSHDALEGAFLHGAYMGDAEFSDRFPSRPLSYFRRLHRWVRGDWQNTPWLFRRGRTLRPIDRWRLFDSLRRSLLPPMTLLAILAGFFFSSGGLRLSAAAALLSLLSRLLLSLAEGGAKKRERFRLRRYTRLLTGVGGAIVQSFARLWLLPYEAWICLSAAVSSLWRLLVTRRKLLEWETAAQSDRRSSGAGACFLAMWPAAAVGLLCLLFAPSVIARSSGLLWLLSPFAASALALPARKERSLGRADRDWLRCRAGEIWRYFAECCSREDNYLPPDNVQEQPPVGAAHRSSPTNIGFAAAAAAAACDLELVSSEEACAFLARMLDTLERMPRCLGHFYNWYDTRTLLPLHPACLSTVDSGNLCAGLLTAARFSREAAREDLAGRFEMLLRDMDFGPLYDPDRNLFYICYDPARGCGTGGWYDLLASEARLTSYLAVARGDVPIRHWRRLSRAQLQKDGYRGLASWTGTMFEYLMPELFLPLYRGSLLSETARFCLYVQRRRVLPGRPWGVSESAFFALDNQLSYRYKAHGCQALALKRGMDAELVIAPYASFLALAVDPESAVGNLRRLERLGMLGRWGFFEALDLTPARCRCDAGEPVRCTMAHHAAMSLLAAANALCSGSIVRRFMADPGMSAHRELLQERLPEDGAVLRRDLAPSSEPPERSVSAHWRRRGNAEDEGACLLSNGFYNLSIRSDGCSRAFLDELLVRDELRLLLNGQTLLPARQDSWEMGEDCAVFRRRLGSLSCRVTAAAALGDCGEYHTLSLRSEEARSVRVGLVFRPLLAREEDARSHPAFWALGLLAENAHGSLLLRRLARGPVDESWLCLACDRPMHFQADESGGTGWLFRPEVRAETALELKAGENASLRFALCLARDREAALAGAQRMLTAADTERGCMLGASATMLGLSADEIGAAMDLLPALTENRLADAAPRRELWPYGVSGELPLLCCEGDAKEARALLDRFLLLKSLGLRAELCYLSDEGGEYLRPFHQRIAQALGRCGLSALLGSRGGVHILPTAARAVLESRAAVFIGRERRARARPPLSPPAGERARGGVPSFRWMGRGFEFEAGDALPSRPWQQLLTNGAYTVLALDDGGGQMWVHNAREMTVGPMGGEALWVESGGKPLSLFAANDGHRCRVTYAPGLAVWDKELGDRHIKTTAFVPADFDGRVLLIEGAGSLPLVWKQELTLGAPDGSSLRCFSEGATLRAENPEAYLPDLRFLASCSAGGVWECAFSPAAAVLRVTAQHLTVLVCGFGREARLNELCRPDTALAVLSGVSLRWAGLLDRLELSSPVAALDHYLNGWAAYQAIACRLMARGTLYQHGGAIGFRDQLQDAVNLLLLDGRFARERILDACRHQYVEGDVLHWWHPHPEGDRGVRTRCSDDLLWLVWALCELYDADGDATFCLREERYISSPPLREDEHDRYERPEQSEARASVLDHARAALDRCISRGFGAHGLPLIGSGDWCDGMDAVDGESVWLGWFLGHCARRFAALLDALEKPGAERCRECAAAMEAACAAAFNGRWYQRGYWADGAPLGGEARVDSLAQSWAVLSGLGRPEHADAALSLALLRLTDRKHRLIRLFDPPFGPDERSPGYLSSYGEGLRENGGQYTHGAIWLARACLHSGRIEDGWELLELLLPETHDPRRYAAEPWVLPADVGAVPGREGEAGWTWYTGSAAWYFRVVTEDLLGLQLRGGQLFLRPRLPAALPRCRVRWTNRAGKRFDIRFENGEITVDGEKYHGQGLPNS